ncbi:MAG: murein biosynthesis integral membrane protein MurJ [Planctomycetaceae bacterium]|nr:murein biosynthesis integral membrane protein MurJ [Planctomycetaceae bacterium]
MAAASKRHPLIAGTVVTSLGTLASRVLGMVRTIVTAALFGLAGRGVADAFLFAFRIPNLFRQLFGEGALTASYLPVLTTQLDADPCVAHQLASVVISLLAALLAGVVLAGELLLWVIWAIWGDRSGVTLLVGLSAVMLPYLMLICVAAQLSTMLYAARHFGVPALAPTMLNIVWLLAALVAWVWFSGNQVAQAYVLAVGVLVAGICQVVVQLPTIRRLGYRFDFNWTAAQSGLKQIGHNFVPMLIGMAVTQINTFNDSLIAWGLARAPDGPEFVPWLGGAVRYPMHQGAVAAIFYGDQLSEFPLGLVGMAVAVAIFPLLSQHAARGDRTRLGGDMTLGLRLVFCLALPAGVGLILLAEPIARLLLEHGYFNREDTARTATMIAWYASGVWAYCASQVVVRGFYAVYDCVTPVRIAAWMVGMNLALNLTLIWPMAEAGLAASTSMAAAVQTLVLMAVFSRRYARLGWRELAANVARSAAATAAMAVAVYGTLGYFPNGGRLVDQVVQVGVPLVVGAAVYCGTYRLLGGRELGMLLHGRVS